MTYVLYGAALALTWFVAMNVALSLLSAAASAPIAAAIAGCAPAVRARILLIVRLLPGAGSTIFIAAVFLPSFWLLEPRDFDETFGLTITATAIAGCALFFAAAWRSARALGDASRRSRAWRAHATPMAIAGAPAPVYCLDAATPAMTLVGVFRPALLVTRSLLEVLTAEELDAAIAHEASHVGAWDNLKRLTMRAMPDALSALPACRRLEQGWALAAEHAADARAARDGSAGLALASALVKVARLTPPDQPALALASPLVSADAIASRVERLMDRTPARRVPLAARALSWTAAAAVVWILIAGYAPLLQTVHEVSEVVVHAVP